VIRPADHPGVVLAQRTFKLERLAHALQIQPRRNKLKPPAPGRRRNRSSTPPEN
jgi:hypothetical protein